MTQTQSDWYLTTSSLGSSNSSATPAVLSPLPALPTGKSLNQSQNLIHTYRHTYVRATVKKKNLLQVWERVRERGGDQTEVPDFL